MSGRIIQIQLSDEQENILAKNVRESVAAHHAEDCIFPGYRLCIDIAPGWGESACLQLDGESIDLGDIDLKFITGPLPKGTDK